VCEKLAAAAWRSCLASYANFLLADVGSKNIRLHVQSPLP
jgi:hypothetical protein